MKTERLVIALSSLITFLLVSAGITAIYCTVGGTFRVSMHPLLTMKNVGLVAYGIIELYLLALVIKISLRRPAQISREAQ